MKITQSTVNIANIQFLVDSVGTHLNALNNAIANAQTEQEKRVLNGLKSNLIGTLELYKIEVKQFLYSLT